MDIMELFQLRYFLEVARQGSVSAAARQLYISQPSLSVQIKNLEEEVGCALFQRSAHGAQLTEAGVRLQRTARRVCWEMDSVCKDLQSGQLYQEPPERLGIQPMLASGPLARCLQAWLDQRPQRKLEIRERFASTLVEMLMQGELDIAVFSLPPQLPDSLESFPLMQSSYAALIPASHPLGKQKSVRLTDLLSERLLLFRDLIDLESRIRHQANKRKISPQILLVTDHAATVAEMCSAQLGIGILPAFLLQTRFFPGTGVRAIRDFRQQSTIGLVWRREQPPRESLFLKLREMKFPESAEMD